MSWFFRAHNWLCIYTYNYCETEDHKALAEHLDISMSGKYWMVTYDKCDEIDTFYSCFKSSSQSLQYCIHREREKGTESVFYSDVLEIPRRVPPAWQNEEPGNSY